MKKAITNVNGLILLVLSGFVLAPGLLLKSGNVARAQELSTTLDAPVDSSPAQIFMVTSSGASGSGTLAQAIVDANANPGADTINFNISGAGIHFIPLNAPLPTITSPVTIDGTSQPGYTGTPLIALSAIGIGQALNITSGNTSVRGLSFDSFLGNTSAIISISGLGNNVITGCNFGVLGNNTRPTTSAIGIVVDGSGGNRIGGTTMAERNYFDEDQGQGIVIRNGAANNRVTGNWFGTGPNGARMTTARDDIRIENSPNNTIGGSVGTTPGGACTGECNVISGTQSGNGVYVTGNTSTGNRIIGNTIGLLADGLTRNQNSNDGIKIENAPGNSVGGTAAVERNVITGNTLNGIEITGAGSTGNVISGNFVGLLTDGSGSLATSAASFIGIVLGGASSATRAGGLTAGERNVISGNRSGISVFGSNQNTIEGNFIGTDMTGTLSSTTIGNGVSITDSSNNMIGGTTLTTLGGPCTGACNVISANGQDGASDGVNLNNATATTIDGNYIGLNVAGNAVLLNGRTPGGAMFNGEAIRMSNSSNNTIGRRVTTPSFPQVDPSSPLTFYCYQDDRTGDYVSFSDSTGHYEAKHCASGRTFVGSGTLTPNGFFSNVGDLNYVFATIPGSSPALGHVVGAVDGFSFEVNDLAPTNAGNCSCTTDPVTPGSQTVAGVVEVGGTGGSDSNFLGFMSIGEFATLEHLPIGPYGAPSVVINGNSNQIHSTVITIPNNQILPPIQILGGFDNSISGINLIYGSGAVGISESNPTINAPSITIVDNPNGGIHLVCTISGAPSLANVRVMIYARVRFPDGNGGTYEQELPTGVQFDVIGNGTIIRDLTGTDAIKIRESRQIRATATIVNQLPDSLGTTSQLSQVILVPEPPLSIDGNGFTDLTVYRPPPGMSNPSTWYTLFRDNSFTSTMFGTGEDTTVPGDYNGDFLTNFGVRRSSNGLWYISNGNGPPSVDFFPFQWGLNTDVPEPGDFNGDGRDDAAVFRRSNGIWYIRDSLNGGYRAQNWGIGTDKTVPGDYNGDGRTDLGVYRDGNWYISLCPTCPILYANFGLPTDIPTPADFDGDGKVDIAVWRPSDGIWYIQRTTAGFLAFQWGQNGDKPLYGDFDGDGKYDIGVWRPSEGNWYIFQSRTNTPRALHWGQNGDLPIPSFEVHFHY